MDPEAPPPPNDREQPDRVADAADAGTPGAQGFTLPSASPHPSRPASGRSHEAIPVVVHAPKAAPVPQVTLPQGQVAQPLPQAQVAQPFRGPSGAFSSLGGEIVEHKPPQLVRVRFPVHEAWFNAQGTLSGGFVSAMLDAVASLLAHAIEPARQHAVLETSTRFLRSIRAGWVVCDATVVRAGRTTAVIECYAWDPSNELCAKGAATLMFLG